MDDARRAAGIAYQAADGRVLLCERDDGQGWAFPGGALEGQETSLPAAERECQEELGVCPPGSTALLMRQVKNGVDFTTYLRKVKQPFPVPALAEHTNWKWLTPADALANPTEYPLHPGVGLALRRLGHLVDELELAEAIRDGELTSPVRYENLCLVELKVTGVGTAYRQALKEYTYRPPEDFLTERFARRALGLPVILEHPPNKMLNGQEFVERTVGAVMLTYLRDDGVYGVARVYDEDATKMLEAGDVSTSPAVVFRDPSANEKLTLEDGKTLLIEGHPSLLDHLALCERGVWDKGGEPTGVTSETYLEARGDSQMTEEELKAQMEKEKEEAAKSDKAKADAEAVAKRDAENGEKLDKILACMDSLRTRVDALEAPKKDAIDVPVDEPAKSPEQLAADRKDGEDDPDKKLAEGKAEADKKAEEAEGDKKRIHQLESELADSKKRLDSLESAMPKEMTDDDMAEMADAQAKADSHYAGFGQTAPRPLRGESVLAYRKRAAKALQAHSPTWKDHDLRGMEVKTFSTVEAQIFADSAVAARQPVQLADGVLQEIKTVDRAGRTVSTFRGNMDAWMGQFKAPPRRLVKINKAA